MYAPVVYAGLYNFMERCLKMFHRVKSEVQGDRQNPAQESDKGYQEESRQLPDANEQEKTSSIVDDKQERPYGRIQPKPQEETRIMKSRETTKEHSSETPRGSYQPSVSRSSGYGASSSSYAGGSPSSSSHSSSYAPSQSPEIYSGNDRTLTIGRGINMSGEIDACDRLMVEGTVEAALKGAKILEIADSGVFYGTVEIEEATIAGRFEGDITVNGRLTIKSTGIVTGSVAYRELEVESGALLDGRMTPIKGAVDPKSVDRYRAGSEATAMAKAKEIPSKKDNREPANTESGLFSKAHTAY